ncbi:MAG: maleylpyruvate isomerase N-terminal domain-containing protein, partial [Acidimicrobiales bacterium]
MSETEDRYTRVAHGFGARLAAVGPTHWTDPSPCPDWTARDVVVHVISTHVRVLANLDGADAAEVDGDGDLATQWQRASDAMLEALGDPDRASRTVG